MARLTYKKANALKFVCTQTIFTGQYPGRQEGRFPFRIDVGARPAMASYLRPRDIESALAAMAEAPPYDRCRWHRLLPRPRRQAARRRRARRDGHRIPGCDRRSRRPLPNRRAGHPGPRRSRRRYRRCSTGSSARRGKWAACRYRTPAPVVGNVCNASPAADGVPNLLALDAGIELASCDATRSVPIGEFITGNRKTLRARDEIVTRDLDPQARRRDDRQLPQARRATLSGHIHRHDGGRAGACPGRHRRLDPARRWILLGRSPAGSSRSRTNCAAGPSTPPCRRP